MGKWQFDEASALISRIAANGWRTPKNINPKTYVPQSEVNTVDLLNALEYISPSELDYQEWVNVGMALKQEGTA